MIRHLLGIAALLTISLGWGCGRGDSLPTEVTQEQLQKLDQEQQDAERLEREQRQ